MTRREDMLELRGTRARMLRRGNLPNAFSVSG
jgi:hypothetical protein